MNDDYLTDLLLVVPHPDDEVFGSGALLARTAARGRAATLTLTRGAAGRTLGLTTRAGLAERREAELRASLEMLGVQEVTILDHPDYVPDADRGMPAHAGLAALSRERLVSDVLAVIDRTRPRAVLTFPPNGANGHPDHCLTNEVVLEAHARAALRPARLYYFANPARFAGPQRPGFLPEEEMHARYLPPTHCAPAGEELATKLAAMGCHETQALSVLGFMREQPHRLLEETFHLVSDDPSGAPEASGAAPLRVDLL